MPLALDALLEEKSLWTCLVLVCDIFRDWLFRLHAASANGVRRVLLLLLSTPADGYADGGGAAHHRHPGQWPVMIFARRFGRIGAGWPLSSSQILLQWRSET